jgi:hypothetical protein
MTQSKQQQQQLLLHARWNRITTTAHNAMPPQHPSLRLLQEHETAAQTLQQLSTQSLTHKHAHDAPLPAPELDECAAASPGPRTRAAGLGGTAVPYAAAFCTPNP